MALLLPLDPFTDDDRLYETCEPFREERPAVHATAAAASCAEHGRRPPWAVCRHLDALLRGVIASCDYRLYRVAWLYEGVCGTSAEYRVCFACASACGLLAERVGVDRAVERLQECVVFICSGCGISRLSPPSQKPHQLSSHQ